MSKSAIEKIKELQAAQSIQKKTISLKDIIAKEGNDNKITLQITGVSTKHVPKYATDTCYGYHTMVYLKDGRSTGGFSNALYDFACFLYRLTSQPNDGGFAMLTIKDGWLDVEVEVVSLDKGKTTYNFEIVSGELNGSIKYLTDAIAAPLALMAAPELEAE